MMVPNLDDLTGTTALVADVGIEPTVASTDIDKLDVMLPPTLAAATAAAFVVGAAAFVGATSTDMADVLGAVEGNTGEVVAVTTVKREEQGIFFKKKQEEMTDEVERER